MTDKVSKSDERLIKAMQDPECRAAIDTLIRLGYRPGTLSDAWNAVEMMDLPDDARISRLKSVGIPIAHTDGFHVMWYMAYGHVWRFHSANQCDCCGPLAKWVRPDHAKAYRNPDVVTVETWT